LPRDLQSLHVWYVSKAHGATARTARGRLDGCADRDADEEADHERADVGDSFQRHSVAGLGDYNGVRHGDGWMRWLLSGMLLRELLRLLLFGAVIRDGALKIDGTDGEAQRQSCEIAMEMSWVLFASQKPGRLGPLMYRERSKILTIAFVRDELHLPSTLS
jgi:hypothetical protein